jgi:hypothetical protein
LASGIRFSTGLYIFDRFKTEPHDALDPGTMKFGVVVMSFWINAFGDSLEFVLIISTTGVQSSVSHANGRHMFGESELFTSFLLLIESCNMIFVSFWISVDTNSC